MAVLTTNGSVTEGPPGVAPGLDWACRSRTGQKRWDKKAPNSRNKKCQGLGKRPLERGETEPALPCLLCPSGRQESPFCKGRRREQMLAPCKDPGPGAALGRALEWNSHVGP